MARVRAAWGLELLHGRAESMASRRPSTAAGGSMTVDLSLYSGERRPAPFRPVSARCRAGLARRDVTPPVGIYNRNWGAAAGDVATGIHMPLYTTGLALACAAGGDGPTLLLVTVDLGWLLKEEITLAKAAEKAGMVSGHFGK